MKHNLLFIILFLVFFPLSSRGAVLYLEPESADYHPGDTVVVSLRIDTEQDCINTVSARLSFPKDILEAIDFSQGNSLLTLWINPPLINPSAGAISFTGGIPGGYCGRIPGDPGESNLLGKIIFKVKEAEPPEVQPPKIEFLASSQVLLNDGLGTPAKLSAKGAVFTILPGASEVPRQEWQEEITKDTIPPEVFKIEINQDPSIFEGKYFITFSTTDKQTGLDYYEVTEGEGERSWQRATSPYLLEDQGLRSIIKVRAVDKAGNYLVVEQLPTNKPIFYKYFTIILVLITGVIAWFITKKIRHKL